MSPTGADVATHTFARMLRACRDLSAGREPQACFTGDDAQAFRRLVRAHGLSGVALRAIEGSVLVLPDAVVNALRGDWEAARLWCAALDDECARIGGLAAELDLRPPMLIKGATVARRYAEPALRTYVDFDLLVAVADFERWTALLAGAGYHGPRPELAATRRRLQHSINLSRPSPAGPLGCDLHGCLFVERRARELVYERLVLDAEAGPFAGLCQPSLASALVVLALHLVQHAPAHRHLIWVRDFVELTSNESVAGARDLAAANDLSWALEAALWEVEKVLERPLWGARPHLDPRRGLAKAHQLTEPGYLHHWALLREQGVAAGTGYLLSRIDPRRFERLDGRVDWREAASWVRQACTRAMRTPWRSGVDSD